MLVVKFVGSDWVPLLDLVELFAGKSSLDRSLSRRVGFADEAFV